jgi:1-deoxy-D-xylulose-5-phosphate reductoisomerase
MSVPGIAVSKVEPAIDVRSITILGATGSIGASTVDLIKREPERYRVESISARRNAAALGKIAREVGARHAVVADPRLMANSRARFPAPGSRPQPAKRR